MNPAKCKASVQGRQCARKSWEDGWCKQHHKKLSAAETTAENAISLAHQLANDVIGLERQRNALLVFVERIVSAGVRECMSPATAYEAESLSERIRAEMAGQGD